MEWLTRWRERRARRRLDKIAARVHDDLFILAKSGDGGYSESRGWNTLLGTDLVQDASEIWQNYSIGQLEEVYRVCAVVFACINAIVTAAREAPIMIGRKTKEGWEPLPDHPIMRVLEYPYANMLYADWAWQTLIHLYTTGYCYTVEIRNNAGYIDKLMPAPTSWVTPRDNYFELYWGTNSQPKRVPFEDMTIGMFPDPRNPGKGCGPVQAMLHDYQTDKEREDYMVEMLTNLRVPGMILKQEAGWTDDEKNEARMVLADVIGRGNRGGPLFIGGKESSAEMVAPLKDLDWPGLTGLSEARMCASIGVPAIVAGLRVGLEHGTYSNFEQAERSFYNRTMLMVWSFLEGMLTRGLLWDESDDRSLSFRHDLSGIKQLQYDRAETAGIALNLFHGGLIDRNRGLEMVGEPPVDGRFGEVYLQPINLIEVLPDGEPLHELPAPADDADANKDKWDETEEEEDEKEKKEQEDAEAEAAAKALEAEALADA
jgi:phage portal protein BeeE